MRKEKDRVGSVAVRFQTAQLVESSGPFAPQTGSLWPFFPTEILCQKVGGKQIQQRKRAMEVVFEESGREMSTREGSSFKLFKSYGTKL